MDVVEELLSDLSDKGIKLSVEQDRLNCYSPKGMLTKNIERNILKLKPQIIERIMSFKHDQIRPEQEVKEQITHQEFPLSAGEAGLYFLQTLHPEMSAYNVPLCFSVRGEIDHKYLDQAWAFLIKRFPILNANVVERESGLFHRIDFRRQQKIRYEDLPHEGTRNIQQYLQTLSRHPFDLNRDPLARVTLFKRSDVESILSITVHHLVFDGISSVILLKTLLNYYQKLVKGERIEIKTEPAIYQDFVEWESALLNSKQGESHAKYWQRQLNGNLPNLAMPTDQKRQSQPSYRGDTLVSEVPSELSLKLGGLAKQLSVPTSVLFLGLFKLFLQKHTRQDDIIVGMPVMGRSSKEFQQEIGYFINMVPIRTNCGQQSSLEEYLRDVQGTVLDALYHSRYPFPLMLNDLEVSSKDKSPVFQVTFAYQNFITEADFSSITRDGNLEIQPLEGVYQEGNVDLGIEIFEKKTSFEIHLKYNPDLYSKDLAKKMYSRYCQLLAEACLRPEQSIHEYTMLTDSEHQLVTSGFNQTAKDYHYETTLHKLFVEQAKLHPNNVALVFAEQELTYHQLYQRSYALATRLQMDGVAPDMVVGLCAERSADMIIGILGILLAGGAYLPIDPALPTQRINHMIGDSDVKLVVTQERLRRNLSHNSSSEVRFITLDEYVGENYQSDESSELELLQLNSLTSPNDLAYVIYTSGSTGASKGVGIEHKGACNMALSAIEIFSVTDTNRVLQNFSICFDGSVFEIFIALLSGATLVITSEEEHHDPIGFVDLLGKQKVDLIMITPSFLNALEKRDLPIKTLVSAGEAANKETLEHYSSRGITCFNAYGPSEITVVSNFHKLSSNLDVLETVPIGPPIGNTEIYITDAYENLVPIGVPGELNIAGAGVGREYLNRKELTEKKFVENPFDAGKRMYKSGDLARWLPDGNIEYLGRIDTQIKIRGFRVELGEIENKLEQHESVQACCVVAQGHDDSKRIVAFYTQDARAKEIDEKQENLKVHLQKVLPDYMQPSAYVALENMPVTATGKVDRKALEDRTVMLVSSQRFVAPSSAAERAIAEIWASVLDRSAERLGINDNFFEIGGQSLLATQLNTRLRQRFDIEMPLKAIFDNPTIKSQAEFVDSALPQVATPSIPVVDRASYERIPLSYAQERLWFIDQMSPGQTGYSIVGAVKINQVFDVENYRNALKTISQRHESLRTVFPSSEGIPEQRILDNDNFSLEQISLAHISSNDDREREAKAYCQTQARMPFDLAEGPLIRSSVIELSEAEFVLLFNMHHIISDGWSISILMNELTVVMDTVDTKDLVPLEPLAIQYVDYAVWQRNRLQENKSLSRQLDYWKNKLRGTPECTQIILDHPRPLEQSHEGSVFKFSLKADVVQSLNALAKQSDCTLYMVLLAAFKVLLYRYTGQKDLCLGGVIANRNHQDTEALVGMFVNTIALRTQLDGDEAFLDTLRRVKSTCVEAYENQDAPFEKVVEAADISVNTAISPLFQVMFVLQNTPALPQSSAISRFEIEPTTSKFELDIEFVESSDGLDATIEYCSTLFNRTTIERIAQHFAALCSSVVENPTTKIDCQNYIGKQELNKLLLEFFPSATPLPVHNCVHTYFDEQARKTPDRVALVHNGERYTYSTIHERASVLAKYLQSKGVGPESTVGISVDRSPELIIGIFGILIAGGAYVPLDPDYPISRLEYMLRDSKVSLVLTSSSQLENLTGLENSGCQYLLLDRDWESISKMSERQLERKVQPHNLAYVIYTSGSTGKPKGVMVSHDSVVNHNIYARKTYGITADDKQIQFSSMGFDLFVEEVFVILGCGAQLILEKKNNLLSLQALEQLIESECVTVLNVPTAFFHQLIASDVNLHNIKTIIVGGEKLNYSKAEQCLNTFPKLNLFNSYGPTEATIVSTILHVTKEIVQRYEDIPIGFPIANTQLYVLDKLRNPVAIGVAGELYIAGKGLARGYLNKPELTAEKFVRNVFDDNQLMYKSGDVVRWLPDGNMEFLGREDSQVKIRGFRVETGEIDAVLGTYPGILDCVVVAQDEKTGKRLVAFYTKTSDGSLTQSDILDVTLKSHLEKSLPSYMIPSAFVALEEFPFTPNGKIDLSCLESHDVVIDSAQKYVAPVSQLEKTLAEIWAEVLQTDVASIGIHDEFFELGGHSLLAAQLMAKINKQYGKLLPLSILFSASNIAKLANAIEAEQEIINDIVVPIETSGGQIPIFAIPGAGGNVLSLQPLSEAFGKNQPFYALQAVGLDDSAPPFETVESTARANIEAIRSVQEKGPYKLMGHSYGGIVAYEMARILLEENHEVESLVLLDTLSPGHDFMVPPVDDHAILVELCSALCNSYDLKMDLSHKSVAQVPRKEFGNYLSSILALGGIDIGIDQSSSLFNVFSANERCMHSYVAKPLRESIKVTLFQARERLHDIISPEEYGWDSLLSESITKIDLTANHYSIMGTAMAKKIVSVLNKNLS